MPSIKNLLLWTIALILVWVFVSEWVALTMGFGSLCLYIGGWYVILRALGVVR